MLPPELAEYDQASSFAWASVTSIFDNQGVLDRVTHVLDDGHKAITDWDRASSQAWTVSTSSYKSEGQLDNVQQKLDDGRIYFTDYDDRSVFSWKTAVSEYVPGRPLVCIYLRRRRRCLRYDLRCRRNAVAIAANHRL